MTDLEQQACNARDAGDWARLADLAHLLDLADKQRRAHMATLHQAALWYVSAGLHVFPLQPGTKIPYSKTRGCHDATGDAGQVSRWWTMQPDSNIGIATGHLVDVIDVDGVEGAAAWYRNMFDDHDDYRGPEVVGKVSTPRPGGTHIYIPAKPGRGNKAGYPFDGIDYRGAGGYVVAPPSVTQAGMPGVKHPGTYRWTRPPSFRGE